MAIRRKTKKKIKAILIAAVLIIAAGAAFRYLPFPWYVRKEIPITYFTSETDGEAETGVAEIRGWMLHYLVQPDTFRGTIETIRPDATFRRGEFKATVQAVFDRERKPDVPLEEGYRYLNIGKADCEGDVDTFIAYWMDRNRAPLIEKRFDSVILQKTIGRGEDARRVDFCTGPAKSPIQGRKVLETFQEANPDYPWLPEYENR